MGTTLLRNATVLAFAGAVGLAGTASARPWDRPERPVQPERVGTPPSSLRLDIHMNAAQDGRADLNDARPEKLPAYTARDQRHVDHGFAQDRTAVPVKSDIALQVNGGDGDEAPAAGAIKAHRDNDKRANRTYHDSEAHPAPVAIKSDIVMKCQGGEESLVNPVVKPNDQRPQQVDKNGEREPLHANQLVRSRDANASLHRPIPMSLVKHDIANRTHGSGGTGDTDER
jgi:hypothetical protein